MLVVKLDGDGALAGHDLVDCGRNAIVTLLRGGTASGRHSVGFAVQLPDGRTAFAQATAREFLTAADMIRTRIAMDEGAS